MEILIGVLVLVTLIVGSVVIVQWRRVSIGGRTLDDARHEAYRHPEVGGRSLTDRRRGSAGRARHGVRT